jgi:RNA polymerase sigma factor (sigma-70 family)
MATRQANPVLRHIRGLAGEGGLSRLTDRQLLECFTAQADQAAFETLVRRHGPMVLRVCRSVLHDDHAADDAFQATFLVLARKAGSLRRQELLASWLYGVAHRVAARARVEAAKRLNREAQAEPRTPSDPAAELSTREVCTALEEEMAGLPEKYRTPFYLCHVEGRTRDQAARQLGCSVRTLQRLLERGRALLQGRLGRRGVTLSAALLAVTLHKGVAAGFVPEALLTATLTTARASAAGEGAPAPAAALAEGVVRRMAAARMKLLAVLGLALVTTTAGLLARPTPIRESPQVKPPGDPVPAAPAQARLDTHGDPLPPGALLRLGSLRLRAGAPVFAVVPTPDGKGIFSGSRTPTARLWEVDTGKELRRFDLPQKPGAPQPNTISSLTLSPDGCTLATGSWSGPLYLWEVATGKLLRTLPGPRNWIHAVAFSPDGKLLASAASYADQSTDIVFWDAATGKQLRRLQGHSRAAVCLAFSPNGKLLASGGQDGEVRLWDTATGKPANTWQAHRNQYVTPLAFSPDGKTLASAGHDNTLRLWEVATGKLRVRLPVSLSSHVLAFSPDGRLLAGGSHPGHVFLWDTATGRGLGNVPGHADDVRSLAFVPRGKRLLLATGCGDGTLRLFELPDSTTLLRRKAEDSVIPTAALLPMLGHQSGVFGVAVSPDGKTIATGSQDRTVRIWDAASGKELRRHEGYVPDGHIDWVTDLCYSRDGKLLASADNNGRVFVREAATGKTLHKLPGRCMAFSPNGKLLATATNDRAAVIRLWDLATGQELRQLRGHKASVFRLAFSPDGRTLASGGMGVLLGLKAGNEEFEVNTMRLWDVASGKQLRQFGDPREYVHALAFTPDGRTLVSGGDPRGGPDSASIRLWETATGKERGRIAGHRDRVWSLAVSPDGRHLASASSDGNARLWDLHERKEIRRLEGHRGWVTAVAFGHGGRTLVSGSWDTTALVWDLRGLSEDRRR